MFGYGWRHGPHPGAYTEGCCPGPHWGLGYRGLGYDPGPDYYPGPEYSGPEIDRATVEQKAHAILRKATKGSRWVDPRGVSHFSLVVEGGVVGNLWEDADPASLQVAGYWVAGFGVRVELAREGRVVGLLGLAA